MMYLSSMSYVYRTKSSYSSFDGEVPRVEKQLYEFPRRVRTSGVSTTKRGITTKLLIGTGNKQQH